MSFTLVSWDGHEEVVERDVAEQCRLIRDMLQDVKEIPKKILLPNVREGDILTRVLDYCTHHRGKRYRDEGEEGKPSYKERMAAVTEWDERFINDVDNDTLRRILSAADYLDIPGLVDLGCKTAAAMINGRSTEDIRKIFNIKNDLSKADQAKIQKEDGYHIGPEYPASYAAGEPKVA